MTKHNQLNKDERDTIQYMLDKGIILLAFLMPPKKTELLFLKRLKEIDLLIILIKNILIMPLTIVNF